MTRIVIYSSDIVKITGKSESYARKEINRIKTALKKEKHQKVTIEEYCNYYGFEFKVIKELLSNCENKISK